MTLKENQPIMFSTEAVRAILAGRKTQTRRLSQGPVGARDGGLKRINNDPHLMATLKTAEPINGQFLLKDAAGKPQHAIECFWRPGMKLWVKEVWSKVETEDGFLDTHIRFQADDAVYARFSDTEIRQIACDVKTLARPSWESFLLMPMWASRIALRLTDVRLERLQWITEADALAEGIDPEVWEYRSKSQQVKVKSYRAGDYPGFPRAVACFAAQWDSFHAERYGMEKPEATRNPWSSNP
ncbi:MAG TPA: hypothetical protein VIW07_13110, partial [Candidatus Udaeobacter sp.]